MKHDEFIGQTQNRARFNAVRLRNFLVEAGSQVASLRDIARMLQLKTKNY